MFDFSMENEDVDQTKFMNLNKFEDFDIVSLYYIPEFYLSRIYIKRKKDCPELL